MHSLRKHIQEKMEDAPPCGVKDGCPSSCSCSHILNKGNKQGKINK